MNFDDAIYYVGWVQLICMASTTLLRTLHDSLQRIDMEDGRQDWRWLPRLAMVADISANIVQACTGMRGWVIPTRKRRTHPDDSMGPAPVRRRW